MRRRFIVTFFQFLLLVSICFGPGLLPAHAAIPPITPEDLAMKSEPLAPGAAAIILYREVDRDDNGRTSHEDNFLRIKILTEEGRKYANVDIPFIDGRNNVVNVKAHTIRPDGSIVNFDGKVANQTIVKARGAKQLSRTLALPEVQVGSIIEYSYSYDFTEHLIYDSHWILSDELFTRLAVFTLKPYTSTYARFSLSWRFQGLPPGAAPPSQGPDHIIRLTVQNVPAFRTEDYMPPENELKARVDFIYTDDPTDMTPEVFWKHIGKERYAEMDHFINKRNAMQQAVAQIVTPQDPPEEKLKKIYHRVQQLRNTSYEFSKTKQEEKREENKKKPNAEDIWSRGYGEDEQINWLYLALVRAAGLEADGVWVSSRRNYFFRPKVEVDQSRLNYNIVQVHLNGSEIYCDPGAKFTPYGLLPWYETGVAGLRIDKDGGTWIETPIPPASASVVERKADLNLTETGDLEGKLTLTFTGLEAVRRRNDERNQDATERKNFLEDTVRSLIPAACEPTLTNQPDWDSSATPLVAEFTLKVPGWAAQTGRRVMLPVGLFSAQEKHLFDHADRVHPIYMDFPFQTRENVAITIPTGLDFGTLPPEQKRDGHVVVYSMALSRDKSTLRISRDIKVDFLLLDKKYYASLRTFFQEIKTSNDQQIMLQTAATSASR